MGARPPSIRASLDEHLAALAALKESGGIIEQAARLIHGSLAHGGKVLTCGNGGSAAEALHLAEEMMGRYSRTRAPLAAVCLSADPTALTCIANDFGYDEVFARQVAGLGRKGDVLVALTTSGTSATVVKALQAARGLGLITIGLLGRPGSPAQDHCDLAFTATIGNPAQIQEMHLIAIHLILEYLDGQV